MFLYCFINPKPIISILDKITEAGDVAQVPNISTLEPLLFTFHHHITFYSLLYAQKKAWETMKAENIINITLSYEHYVSWDCLMKT